MLFAFCLCPQQAVFHRQRGGFQSSCDHHRFRQQDFRHDRLAHRLHARSGSARGRQQQTAKPVDLQPNGVTCEWPGGAFYAFPNISSFLANGANGRGLAKSCTELARQLLDQVQVAVVPGEAFGAPGYLRLSYATSIERIDEGLRRLEKFFTRVEAAA